MGQEEVGQLLVEFAAGHTSEPAEGEDAHFAVGEDDLAATAVTYFQAAAADRTENGSLRLCVVEPVLGYDLIVINDYHLYTC